MVKESVPFPDNFKNVVPFIKIRRRQRLPFGRALVGEFRTALKFGKTGQIQRTFAFVHIGFGDLKLAD
jgi:hypothetical protein